MQKCWLLKTLVEAIQDWYSDPGYTEAALARRRAIASDGHRAFDIPKTEMGQFIIDHTDGSLNDPAAGLYTLFADGGQMHEFKQHESFIFVLR